MSARTQQCTNLRAPNSQSHSCSDHGLNSITRRTFLRNLGLGLAATPLLSAGCTENFPETRGVLYGAASRLDSQTTFRAFSLEENRLLYETELPLRAHASVANPHRAEVAVVGRRPATLLFIVGLLSGNILREIESPEGRHFLGHAVYSKDGRLLLACENVYESGALPDLTPKNSVIGVYDVANGYRRIREFSTGGVGAHELLLSSDGQELIIANGGIYTHPDRPREKLNLDTMQPNLCRMSLSGEVRENRILADHQLGIRHIARGPNLAEQGGILDKRSPDTTFVACQYLGEAQALPLLYSQSPDNDLLAFQTPENGWSQFDNYIGSVAYHQGSDTVIATSPRGDIVGYWRGETRTFLGSTEFRDTAGLAVLKDFIIASNGAGEILIAEAADPSREQRLQAPDTRWDNHCFALGS